jgi:hypothetical protein
MPDGRVTTVSGSMSVLGSVATAQFGDDNYVFFYSDSQLNYAKALIETDDKPYNGAPITYTSTSCDNSSTSSGSDSDSDSDNTVSANDLGVNPLAAATWYSDGNVITPISSS